MSNYQGNIKALSINSVGTIQGATVVSNGTLTLGDGSTGLISSKNGTGSLTITTAGNTIVTNALQAGSLSTSTISSTAGLTATSAVGNNISLNTVTIAQGTGNTVFPGTLSVTGATTLASTTLGGVVSLNNGLKKSVTNTSTTPFTVLSSHNIIEFKSTGASVINLPSVSTVTGQEFTIEITADATANNVVITPTGSEKIDGQSTITLNTPGDIITLFSNGVSWRIV